MPLKCLPSSGTMTSPSTRKDRAFNCISFIYCISDNSLSPPCQNKNSSPVLTSIARTSQFNMSSCAISAVPTGVHHQTCISSPPHQHFKIIVPFAIHPTHPNPTLPTSPPTPLKAILRAVAGDTPAFFSPNRDPKSR